MKRVLPLIAVLGSSFGTYKFGVLTYMLLADGQFFTSILAALFTCVCTALGAIFIGQLTDD